MADDSTNKPSQPPQDVPNPTAVNPDKQAKSVVEESHGESNQPNKAQTNTASDYPFVIKVAKKKKWSRAEKISAIGIVLSTLLFGMTLLTFKKTSHAIEISEASLNDARRKDSIAEIRNKAADSFNAILFERNRVKDSVKTSMDSIGLQAQINALNISAKQADAQANSAEVMKKSMVLEYTSDLIIKQAYITHFESGESVAGRCEFVSFPIIRP